MPCVSLPMPPIPVLPSPLKIPLPPVPPPFNVDFCCKSLPFPVPPPIPPIPPIVLSPAVIAAYKAFVKQMTSYLDLLQFPCPKE